MSVSPLPPKPDPSTLQALKAERDADQRIAAAREREKASIQEMERELSHIRDSYERNSLLEDQRNGKALESQRFKGYERLRDLKRDQNTEIKHIRQEGELDSSKLNEFYRDKIYLLQKESRERLSDIDQRGTQEAEYKQKSYKAELEGEEKQYEHEKTRLREENERQIAQLAEKKNKFIDHARSEFDEYSEKTQVDFDQRLGQQDKKNQELLEQVQSVSKKQLGKVQSSTAEILSKYSVKHEDPFYSIMGVDSRLKDDGDQFLFIAKVPDHEREHFSVHIKGDSTLVISGNRRNEETVELGPGHSKGSASFQSFHESFPLNWPVEKNQISRENDGDYLIVRIPKKGMIPIQKQVKGYAPAKTDSPQYPENFKLPPEVTPEEAEKAESAKVKDQPFINRVLL